MLVVVLALILGAPVAGVTILKFKEPAPACPVVDNRVSVTSWVSRADAQAQLAARVKAKGGDKARVCCKRCDFHWQFGYPPRSKWVIVATAYACGTEAREEGE